MAERRRRAGLRDRDRRGATGYGPLAAPRGRGREPLVYGDDPPPPTRRRHPWRWALLLLLLAVLLPAGYIAYNLTSTLLTVAPGSKVSADLPAGSISGTIYLLAMGSDERRDSNGNLEPGEVPHSDTMILLAIDTDHHQVRMLSTPRDLLVSIPGYGADHRINEAYTIGEVKHLKGGGPVLAVKTMSQLTGIQIPYFAVTTFDGFRQTVNTVGGVTIDVTRPITDHDYPGQLNDYMPIYIPAGLQLMDGERALEFVRSRHDDPLSDFGRNLRQQQLLTALSQKLLRPERITQFQTFLDIAKSSIRTNLSPAQALGLARSMVGVKRDQVKTYFVGPTYVSDPTPTQAYLLGAVLLPNEARIRALVQAFEDGTPAPDATPASGG